VRRQIEGDTERTICNKGAEIITKAKFAESTNIILP
jgi:hypothetical protein